MITGRKIFIVLCALCLPLAFALGQITTNGTGGGAWSSTATWAGGVVPDGSGYIVILDGDSVIYDVAVNITGQLTKNSSKSDSIGASGSITFGNGGRYIHAVNGGFIPLAAWQDGATCTITGVTGNVPSNVNQNFYDFNWICMQQSGNLNLGWHDITIGGNVNFKNPFGAQIRLSNNTYGRNIVLPIDTFNVITINGNFTVGDTANVTATGSGTPMHGVRVIVGGNLDCSSGSPTTTMFQLGNGSGASANWWVMGHVVLAACTLNTNGTYPDTLVFCGNGNTQQLVNNGIDLNRWKVKVRTGANFYMTGGNTLGAATVNNTTVFVLEDGATFNCGGDSLQANISVTIPDSAHLSRAANYSFVGSAAQLTGFLMPDTVNDLTIDNANGVFLSKGTVVDGMLNLSNGVLDNCTNNVTVPTARVAIISGSLACTANDVERGELTVPREFKLYNNYPNPFNPTTQIRFTVPENGYTTLKVFNMLGQNVATLFNGIAKAGEITSVVFDATNLPSGVYFARLQQSSRNMIQQMVLVK